MGETMYWLRPVGWVESPLTEPRQAPRQADEGAPAAWLVLDPAVRDSMRGLRPGSDVLLLTWLDRARRDVQLVHPRDDESRPLEGVFNSSTPAHRTGPIRSACTQCIS